jgi:Ribbon-helix-helix protein, copG family
LESRITVRLDVEVKKMLNARAKKSHLTSAELVRQWIVDGLLEHDKHHAQLVSMLSEMGEKLEQNTTLSAASFGAASILRSNDGKTTEERRQILKDHILDMVELGANIKKQFL